MEPLTLEQQKTYDAEIAAYQACGHFSNRQVGAFRPFVKDGVLDEAGVMKQWGLNDRQMPFLKIELDAAGYLVKPEPKAVEPVQAESAKATKPLAPITEPAAK